MATQVQRLFFEGHLLDKFSEVTLSQTSLSCLLSRDSLPKLPYKPPFPLCHTPESSLQSSGWELHTSRHIYTCVHTTICAHTHTLTCTSTHPDSRECLTLTRASHSPKDFHLKWPYPLHVGGIVIIPILVLSPRVNCILCKYWHPMSLILLCCLANLPDWSE